MLHHYLDIPMPEVALILGIPVGTSKSRLHRALNEMRASLEADARNQPSLFSLARMTSDDRFGGTVSVWLEERAGDRRARLPRRHPRPDRPDTAATRLFFH